MMWVITSNRFEFAGGEGGVDFFSLDVKVSHVHALYNILSPLE